MLENIIINPFVNPWVIGIRYISVNLAIEKSKIYIKAIFSLLLNNKQKNGINTRNTVIYNGTEENASKFIITNAKISSLDLILDNNH